MIKIKGRLILYLGEFSLNQNAPSKLVLVVAKQFYIKADSLFIESDRSAKFW